MENELITVNIGGRQTITLDYQQCRAILRAIFRKWGATQMHFVMRAIYKEEKGA